MRFLTLSFAMMAALFTQCFAASEDANPHPAAASDAALHFTAEQLRLPGKKGIGFTLRAAEADKPGNLEQNLARILALDVAWNYSWGSQVVAGQPASSEFIPMSWGAWGEAGLKRNLDQQVRPEIEAGRVHRFLGFNEPDKKDQANMSYENALRYWPLLETLGVPLVSPACANPEGIDDPSAQGVSGTWMRDFIREVDARGLRVDYVGVHWYGGPQGPQGFKDKLQRIYERYGKRPLLITEFAPADWKTGGDITKHRHTPAQVLTFMKDVLPWLESQDWIAGYAWFPFNANSPQGTSSALFHEDGSLTACGRYYRSVTPANPQGDQSIDPD
jgi:hypothetical protein